MTQEYLTIGNNLVELISLLDKYGEKGWSEYFKHLLDLVHVRDRQGVILLTQMNQGMGSFNDLVICKLNGHKINEVEEDNVNATLNRLFTAIISAAQKIRISE